MIRCPRCSWDSPDGADTCLACGGRLPATAPATAPAAERAPAAEPPPAAPSAPTAQATSTGTPAPDADDERALRRAAQRERREREEAYRRAHQQAVDTEREARDVAARVAALVVQTGATQLDAEETIRRMPAEAGDAARGVAGAAPVKPTGNVRSPRAAPDAAAGSTADLKPGETPCALCGTGNAGGRRFCRRCGHPFGEEAPAVVGPRTRWWSRLGRSWGAHVPSIQLWPQGRAVPSRRTVTGVAAVVALALVVLGPWHLKRANIREHLFPRPQYIKPDQVTVEPKALYDGFDTPATVAGGTTVHFQLQTPVDLFKVGVEAKSTVPGVPTPDQLVVTIPGSRRTCTLLFAGNGGFHSTTCRANKVTAVDVRVAQPTSGRVQINEVEFFERS